MPLAYVSPCTINTQPIYPTCIEQPYNSGHKHLNTMYTITTSAPTGHYVNAITALGQGFKQLPGGALTGARALEFDTEEQAKQHLIKLAERLNDADPNGSDDRLQDMIASVEVCGRLYWDSATAEINED